MSKLANQNRSRACRVPICHFASLLVCSFALSGCLERTITITSTPPDAIVWINDVEVGRTPVTTGFNHFGDFDVRLRHEGYEPLVTHHTAHEPLYEYAPFDLVATAWPGRIQTKLEWHFDLTPLAPPTPETDASLVERAKALQATIVPSDHR